MTEISDEEDQYTKAALEFIDLAIVGARQEGDEPLKAIERIMKLSKVQKNNEEGV